MDKSEMANKVAQDLGTLISAKMDLLSPVKRTPSDEKEPGKDSQTVAFNPNSQSTFSVEV